jgi:N6-adenosine-specific RNA methylase IME4
MTTKYSIIYSDPPWSYKDKACAGKRGACFKYSVMTLEDIMTLPVCDIAAKDCVLFLWSTFPQLPTALDVIKAWGFTYKTVAFNWVKTTRKTGKLFWGMGHWTRSNPEICLLAVRGKPKRISAGVHSVIESPVQAHSVKPSEIRDRIVKLMGDVPRVELFARQRVQGWDCWGNEVKSDIQL